MTVLINILSFYYLENMTEIFKQIRIDEEDPKFKLLKQKFITELKNNFDCEAYEPIAT